MTRRVSYEWIVETFDSHGDILDVEHFETREQAERAVNPASPTCTRLGLVRDVFDNFDYLLEREWAYLRDDGTLPTHFADSSDNPTSTKVPARFRR